MNRVTHFEIQVDEPQRAMQFYKKVFSWKFHQWENNQYWMVMTEQKDSKEPGINGGLLPRKVGLPEGQVAFNAFVCTVEVTDFDKTAAKILKNGGRVAMPKYALVGMAWQGYFLDTEGNMFGVHQHDPKAK